MKEKKNRLLPVVEVIQLTAFRRKNMSLLWTPDLEIAAHWLQKDEQVFGCGTCGVILAHCDWLGWDGSKKSCR